MAIQETQGLSAHPKKIIQTTERPILVRYEYNGSGVAPLIINVDVQVEVQGSYVPTGKRLIINYDGDSSASNPSFTFDISQVLKAYIKNGFYKESLSQATNTAFTLLNTSSVPQSSVVKYKVIAREMSISDNNVLVQGFTTALASEGLFAANIRVDKHVKATSRFSNLNFATSTPEIVKGFVSFDTDGVTLNDSPKLLTNYPVNGRARIISLNQPLLLSKMYGAQTVSHTLMAKSSVAPQTLSAICQLSPSVGAAYTNISTVNVSTDDTYLFSEMSNVSTSSVNSGDVLSFFLRNNSDNTLSPISYKFKILRDVTNNELTPIYFVNDFNVLDYFCFESNVEIINESQTASFSKRKSDYSTNITADFGVASSSFSTVRKCSTIGNRELFTFLSEISRSRQVFRWDYQFKDFIPVKILNAKQTILDSNRKQALFELSFSEDINNIIY